MGRKTRGKGWELISAGPKKKGPGRRTQSAAPEAHGLKIREESRARGKGVTVIRGFKLTEPDLKALCKRLKNQCGSGGSIEAGDASEPGTIEIQGKQGEKLRELLEAEGYGIKS